MPNQLKSSTPLRYWRQLKIDTAVVVQFLRGIEIEIAKSDSARVPRSQIEKSMAYDGVVSNFELMAIFEDQHGRRLRRLWSRSRRGALRAVCGHWILHRGNIGLRTRTSAIKDRRAALIVRVDFVGTAIRVNGVRHHDRESIESPECR
jgi:hypothetical protein